jgi:hypothetical protein
MFRSGRNATFRRQPDLLDLTVAWPYKFWAKALNFLKVTITIFFAEAAGG